jgi:hypothetical protein
MSGVQQATFMNQRSFGPPAIGAAYEGGFFAGQISTTANGVATHNLVIGPLSTAENSSKRWKNADTFFAGASSNIDGPQNTANIVADGNATVYPAAHFCNDLVIGGFSDWYMPDRNELEVCYYNLKPTTTTNKTNGGNAGVNTNAVPSRPGMYTSGTPAQTSAAAFQSGGSEAFATASYWTSTRISSGGGSWYQGFSNGSQYTDTITQYKRVRAVRRVPV